MVDKSRDEAIECTVSLINSMYETADGLHRHAFELETPLASINHPVVVRAEKLLKSLGGTERWVSEKSLLYITESEPELTALAQYVREEKEAENELKAVTKGKRKYFQMFHKGIQHATDEPQTG